jgi:hypothetical protein
MDSFPSTDTAPNLLSPINNWYTSKTMILILQSDRNPVRHKLSVVSVEYS